MVVHWCLLRGMGEKATEGSQSSVHLLFESVSYCVLLLLKDSHRYHWEEESGSIGGRKWTVLN